MRKQIKGKKLSRKSDHRRALLRNLASELFLHEEIKTTIHKAKVLRPYAERLITKAKRSRPSDIQILQKTIYSSRIFKKLTTDIAPRYKDRRGGYTRIYKLGPRGGDGVEMAIVKLV